MTNTEIHVTPCAEPTTGSERKPDPCVVVIFGASGDLTKRKLLPALYHLEQGGLLPSEIAVVGVARRSLESSFAPDMQDGIIAGGGVDQAEAKLAPFVSKVSYFAMNFDDAGGYERLKDYLAEIDEKFGTKGNRLFYLATAPEYFSDIIKYLGENGMAKPEPCKPGQRATWVRTIVEKPFGHDLESARALNDEVNKVFSEDQVFRIDHYLGKETVQNILVFRFANSIFENVWNRNYIDHIEITAAEAIGIEGRGPFYEQAGLLRDVIQNHVMEVLSFIAMEPPVSFEASAVRAEKVKVWRAIQPIAPENTVRGQYGPANINGKDILGYRQEDRVNPESQTETYAALKLEIENWRWAGVPFYIRAGKRMTKRITEVTIMFKQPPLRLFKNKEGKSDHIEPNFISMRIQPDDGITLRFGAKVPGPSMDIAAVDMDFSYADAFGPSSNNGYERLLLDAMLGDATLFAHRDGVEATWSLITPILENWAKNPMKDFPNYAAGTWGPDASDALLRKDGRKWRKL
ncbi:glucose-6-phosphate 1-dehydrogenase [Granulicella pectinivorans]|jgi:glucose-6-phosphate 1-dehydrogenase|uniref:Glucose-6-phosphate 1-dehydrogenase n=1 Tax=Granulicella pectinivorans TaxID=474950 RepID=A0A1I6LSY6_9BACT|nr:glucose-6-phosphate dehydrogenase [Granulicella pectinivorans]SFS06528.1 glucose-6-phosphate 1-dehydrogenase [Granulicella pectinivorans]